ncbi:MAG: tRNA pseudouridine(38-40) synthase TruA [Pseudomonadota bacterium]
MNLALGVEYDGSAFHGFQLQATAPSVQGALEDALSQIAARPVRVAAAGRTDAGVHATGQVVGFRTPVERPLSAWVRGTNSLTPPAVKVVWAREMPEEFHPRYSAVARRYQYLFYEDAAPSPLLRGRATLAGKLNAAAMHRAAQALLGEHDFTTFRAAGCQSLSAHRCIHRITVQRVGALVVLDLTANAFLLHMVRNIAGALVRVGEAHVTEAWLGEILEQRRRDLAGRTAPPDGLYLVDAAYPGYGLPGGRTPALLRAVGGLERF